MSYNMPWEDKPRKEAKAADGPEFKLWGIGALTVMVVFIVWGATNFIVVGEAVAGLIALAIATGWYQFVEIIDPLADFTEFNV